MTQELKTAVSHNFKDTIAKAVELTKEGHEIDILHCQKVSNVYYVLKYKEKETKQPEPEPIEETQQEEKQTKQTKKKSTAKKAK